ncbi:MAG: acyltransferase family protein [bacterium]
MFSIPALTGIRAIAAGAVFFGHVLHQHLNESLPVFKYGWIGVNIFFALSGYLFYHLYVDALENQTFSWKRYLSKRFIRIYPLTILVVLISVLALPFKYDVFDIFTHLTLLHGFYPPYRFSINPPLWTLTVELSFYLIAPVLIITIAGIFKQRVERMKQRNGTVSDVNLAWTVIILWVMIIAFCNGFTKIYQNWLFYFQNMWDASAGTLSIFGRLDDFVAGILIAAYARIVPKGKVSGDILVLAGIAILAWAVMFTDIHGGANQVGKHKLSDFVFPALAFGAGIIIMGLHRGGIVAKVLSTKTMVLLGDISFGLYVWHYVSVPGYAKSALALQSFFETQGIGFSLSALLCYMVYSLLSYASLQFYEKPVAKLLSKRMLK